MKNEAHAIGDRVPNEHDLMLELKRTLRAAGDKEFIAASTGRTAHFSLARRLFGLVTRALRERGNRLALLELNEDQLKDIGLSRCQAYGGYSRYRRSESANSDLDDDPG